MFPVMALSNDFYKNFLRPLAHDTPRCTDEDAAGNDGEDGEPGGLGATSGEKSDVLRASFDLCPQTVKLLAGMFMKVHTGAFDNELRSIVDAELKNTGFTFVWQDLFKDHGGKPI